MSERDQFEKAFRKPHQNQTEKSLDILLEWYNHGTEEEPEWGYYSLAARDAFFWWQASREALKAEQGEDSDLLASAKKIEQEVGDIAERLKQSSDSGFMFVPVADLYALNFADGETMTYTTDPKKALSWLNICGGVNSQIEEYVKLERLQDAMNHPIDTTPNQYEALGKGGTK